MDVFSAIKSRRSVRRFKPDPIEQDTLNQMLDAARLAPSAGNVQPWKFYVVRDRKVQSRLADAALGQTWMLEAPVFIVVCADLPRAAAAYGARGAGLYAIQDTAAAVQNILLGAVSAGLAGCWVGAFREDAVADTLGVDPKVLRPVAIIPLGYAAGQTRTPSRRSLEDVVDYIG